MPSTRISICLLTLLLASNTLSAAEIAGKLRLLEGGKAQNPREARFSVVYWHPQTPVKTKPPATPIDVVTARKDFIPKVIAVLVGTKVRFPNQDPILHNVFSISGENRFDLGLYKNGEAKETTFSTPGLVNVFCNVHHSMVAYIHVLDTPFFAQADGDGGFSLKDLPTGPGALTVWHERAEPKTLKLTLPLTMQLFVDLDLTKPRIPPHRNKFGQPYERQQRGKAY